MRPNTILFLGALVIFFGACSESLDETQLVLPEKPEPGKHLETYVQNDIIFQKTAVVENSDVLHGLFISKSGEVHTFQMPRADNHFEKQVVTKKYIESVVDHSTGVVGQVDLQALLHNYRWNLISGRTKAEQIGFNEKEQATIRYSSYVLATTYTTWTNREYDCPVHHDALARTNRFLHVNLVQEGRYNSTNPGQLVGSVVQWLKETLDGYEIETEYN